MCATLESVVREGVTEGDTEQKTYRSGGKELHWQLGRLPQTKCLEMCAWHIPGTRRHVAGVKKARGK